MIDKNPTNEQIREFWEWCGFTQVKNIWKPAVCGDNWVYPNGEVYRELPPIDPNNLYKYAIPKLIFERWDLDINVSLSGKDGLPGTEVSLTLVKLYRGAIVVDKQFNAFNEDTALALFEAIYEIVKAEKSKTE